MVMMLQKQHIPFWLGDQILIICTFLLRNDLRTLLVAKHDLRTSSGKFLPVGFCHPESSDFLGLWMTDIMDITSMVSNCDDHESSMFPEVMLKFREVMVMLLEFIQKVVT